MTEMTAKEWDEICRRDAEKRFDAAVAETKDRVPDTFRSEALSLLREALDRVPAWSTGSNDGWINRTRDFIRRSS